MVEAGHHRIAILNPLSNKSFDSGYHADHDDDHDDDDVDADDENEPELELMIS